MSAEIRNRMAFSTSNDGLGCDICAIKFHTSAEKNDHILQHFQQIMCTICSQSLIRIGGKWYSLHEHPNTVIPKTGTQENDDNEYEPMLQLEFMAVDTEKIHLSEDHTADDVIPFNEVDPVYDESEIFESNKTKLTVESEHDSVSEDQNELHTNTRIVCPAIGCSKNFMLETGRIKHMKNVHPELLMICDLCEKHFCTDENLRKHKLTHVAAENASFSCDKCDMTFLNKHRLRAHSSAHKNDTVCNVCNQQFSTARGLMKHRESHNKKSVITCRFNGCSQIFESRREFALHSSQHPSDEKKKFICNYCGKSMSRLASLKDHINIHTGERPFECTHCGKFFAKKCSLWRHNLIHSGEKPYACDVEGCEQKFRESIDLKRHKFSAHKIYSKKHICPICSKVFPERKLLTKHTKTVHGNVDLTVANEINN